MKARQMSAIPPLRYYLEKVLRDMGGGILHWAAKVAFRSPVILFEGFLGYFCCIFLSFPRFKKAPPREEEPGFLLPSFSKSLQLGVVRPTFLLVRNSCVFVLYDLLEADKKKTKIE